MEKGRIFGYARVSSKEQNLDRQIDALKKEGVSEEYIVIDKASGKDFQREGYQSFKGALGLREGDTLIVKSIDRLGRNKRDIINEFTYWKDRGVKLKIIDIATTMKDFPDNQKWVQEMINNLLIEVYTSMAEKERETIRQRQAEGIQAAKDRGKHLGRYKYEIDNSFALVYLNWKRGSIKAVEAMRMLNITKTRFYRTINFYEKEKSKEKAYDFSTIKQRYLNQSVAFIEDKILTSGKVVDIKKNKNQIILNIRIDNEYDEMLDITKSYNKDNEARYIQKDYMKCHLYNINDMIKSYRRQL